MGEFTTNGTANVVLAGAAITTAQGGANNGNMTFNSPVLIEISTVFVSTGNGGIFFNNSLNDNGNGSAVVIHTSNNTTLSSVGDINPLESITTNVTGTTTLNGDIETLILTEFNDDVILADNIILSGAIVDMKGDVDNAGFDLTFDTSNNVGATGIDGVLSGTGDFIANGNGGIEFSSINTLTGNLIFNDGNITNKTSNENIFPTVPTIIIFDGASAQIGSLSSDIFTMTNGQTIMGTGECNCILSPQLGSIVSPGNSPGIFSSEELSMATGSKLIIELNGTTVGTNYDHMIVSNAELDSDTNGGAILELNLGFVPNINDSFTIMNVTNIFPVSGTFNGLAEGDTFSVDNYLFAISYLGDNGNDVVISVVGDAIIYVDENAAPMGDGSSWINAFDNLQDALAVAIMGQEIWVAQGVYYPNISSGPNSNDETSTFALIEGVNIYGGFIGNETELNQCDPEANLTILSGDIDGDDTNIDNNNISETVADIQGSNAYHVINGQNITDSTVIDGFTVTAGSAISIGPFDSTGGGMACNGSDGPSINQLIFIGNISLNRGGASNGCSNNVSNSQYISNQSSNGGAIFSTNAHFENVLFQGNSSTLQFGGALVVNGNIYLENVLFSGNDSADSGGAVYAGSTGGGHSLVLINVTMTGNHSVSAGAGLKIASNGTVDISNSIIWNNQYGQNNGTALASIDSNLPITNSNSLIQGFGTTGTANLDEDPLFITDTDPTTAPTIDGNARLMYVSNAIDAGDDMAVTTLFDLDGNDRIQDSAVDMGAYEYTDLIFTNGFE